MRLLTSSTLFSEPVSVSNFSAILVSFPTVETANFAPLCDTGNASTIVLTSSRIDDHFDDVVCGEDAIKIPTSAGDASAVNVNK